MFCSLKFSNLETACIHQLFQLTSLQSHSPAASPLSFVGMASLTWLTCPGVGWWPCAVPSQMFLQCCIMLVNFVITETKCLTENLYGKKDLFDTCTFRNSSLACLGQQGIVPCFVVMGADGLSCSHLEGSGSRVNVFGHWAGQWPTKPIPQWPTSHQFGVCCSNV